MFSFRLFVSIAREAAQGQKEKPTSKATSQMRFQRQKDREDFHGMFCEPVLFCFLTSEETVHEQKRETNIQNNQQDATSTKSKKNVKSEERSISGARFTRHLHQEREISLMKVRLICSLDFRNN